MKLSEHRRPKNSACPSCLSVYDRSMKKAHKQGEFRRVGTSLYRYQPNKVYYGRFTVDGKEVRVSLETTNRKAAETALAKKKKDQVRLDTSKSKTTLADLCDLYLETIHQKPKTIERKKAIVQQIMTTWPTGSKTQVSKIKPSTVKLWLAQYEFGAASRSLYISCIKEIFALAVGDGIITESPADGIKGPKRETPIRRTPTVEQFEQIVADIRSQRFNDDADESADFVEFLGRAGLGQAEARALRWDDINWKEEQIVTFRQKTSSGFAIPLYPQLRPLLEKRHAQRANDGRVFRINDAKKAIQAACRRLGFPAFTARSFRRMFITDAIEKGIDIKVIAEWQGHRDGGALILKTYSHVRNVHSKRMAALMTRGQPSNVVSIKAVAS
jgi:integrase